MASDSNLSSLRFQSETAWGVEPVSPAVKLARFTSDDFKAGKAVVTSEEIRPDRSTPDLAMVGKSATGGFAFELSYTAFQAFIASMLENAPVVVNIVALTCAIDGTAQTLTAAGGSFASVIPGGLVRITGAANAANNGVKSVVSKTNTVLTFAPGSFTTTEASPSLTITGNQVKNGITRSSFFFERQVPTTTAGVNAFQRFLGMTPDTLDMTVESMKIVTGKLGFVGSYGKVASVSLNDSTGTAAAQTLTFAGNAVADETFVVGGVTYTWKAAIGATANQVLVGADADASINNADAAIRLLAGAGTLYGSATVVNPLVTSANGAGDTLVCTAKSVGTAGNSIATTETMTNASWGAATMAGGVNATAPIASDTDPVMNGTSNVGSISIAAGGAQSVEHFKSLSFSAKNNIRALDAIGTVGAFDLGVGRFEVTGKLSSYFRDNTVMAAFLAHDYQRISFTLNDSLGNTIGITFGRISFADANTAIKKINDDNMVDADFTAIYDPVTDAVMVVSFVPHA